MQAPNTKTAQRLQTFFVEGLDGDDGVKFGDAKQSKHEIIMKITRVRKCQHLKSPLSDPPVQVLLPIPSLTPVTPLV